MVSKTVPVCVRWSDWKLGRLPKNRKYSTVSKFKGDNFRDDMWSVELTFDMETDPDCKEWFGRAGFLSLSGPYERLCQGAEFELIEGRKVSAVVKVLSE